MKKISLLSIIWAGVDEFSCTALSTPAQIILSRLIFLQH